eukprot:TRINITY_DN28549_c0_g1_i1.p1 TRINITY_DN28549_c0_g1~~TRINITY_DN28549_c0_g1_i1.p1  ORF type:complete len:542 (-),score=109.80 TRINITY_DN28549_c0_g1_i1:19-1644(-)
MDAAKTIEDIDALQTALNEAETKIYGLLSTSVPKVDLHLPRLQPSVFASRAAEFGRERGTASRDVELAPLLATSTSTARNVGDDVTSAEEVRDQSVAVAARAHDHAASDGAAKKLLEEVRAPVCAAACSLAVAFAVLLLPLPVAAVTKCVMAVLLSIFINFAGVAAAWARRAAGIFDVVNEAWNDVREEVASTAAIMSDLIVTPLQQQFEQLETTIDALAAKQKPILDTMSEMEASLKKVDSSFDIPDLDDLKRPLVGRSADVANLISNLKAELPSNLQSLARRSFAGRVATSKRTFTTYLVVLPLVTVLLLTVGLGMSLIPWPSAIEDHLPHQDIGKSSSHPLPASQSDIAIEGQADAISPNFGKANKVEHADAVISDEPSEHRPRKARFRRWRWWRRRPARKKNADWSSISQLDGSGDEGNLGATSVFAFLMPTIAIILVLGVWLGVSFVLSQAERVVAAGNVAIDSLESTLNTSVNQEAQAAVERIVGDAFKDVQSRADAFFPKFNVCLSTLRSVVEKSAKTVAAAQAVGCGFGKRKK